VSAHNTPTSVTPGKVVALGDHLGADQEVDLAARDPGQHRLGPRPRRHVAIEPRHPRVGEPLGQRGGDTLGAEALALDLVGPAFRTRGRHALAVAAVVDTAGDPTPGDT
jgi:hypothetical protein